MAMLLFPLPINFLNLLLTIVVHFLHLRWRLEQQEPCTGEISNLVRHHKNIELPVKHFVINVLQPVVNRHSLSLDVGHEAHVLHPVSLVQHQVLEVEEGDLALVSIVHGSAREHIESQ